MNSHPAPPEIPEQPIEESAGSATGPVVDEGVSSGLSGPADGAPEPRAAWGLRQTDRLFLIGLSGLIVLLTLVNLIRLSLPGAPAFEVSRLPEESQRFRLDINKANWVEWIQLPEIGESLARQIVADRETHGPFKSVEDLRRVKGIGPATMEKIRSFLKESADGSVP